MTLAVELMDNGVLAKSSVMLFGDVNCTEREWPERIESTIKL